MQFLKRIVKSAIKRHFLFANGLALFFLIWWNSIPQTLFDVDYATLIEDENGSLLTAVIATDGQWRFPIEEDVPPKFKEALLCFEDEHFYSHLGVSARGLGRAVIQNITNLKKVSGGSTLTMQLMRMSRDKHSRSIWQKIIEIIGATRLEFRYSKDELLALYAAHAPMGGNVVGLEAAAWRYFGRKPSNLSWAETATLAVLPNSPALIHPGRNRASLLSKRDRLLKKLCEKGKITEQELELALLESLPDAPFKIPQSTPHLLARFFNAGKRGQRITTTIDGNLQHLIQQGVNNHMDFLRNAHIHNAAVVVMETKTGAVKAYIGNITNDEKAKSKEVDVVPAPRSSGSILKPFLYCHALEAGVITPKSLLTDVPTYMNGYAPKNFYDNYDGLVPADEALSRSLNVPFVRLLIDYSQRKFLEKLKQDGFSNFVFSADHYGTSLILGGAEVSLEDLVNVYANLGNSARGDEDIYEFHLTATEKRRSTPKFEQSSAYHTLNALLSVSRPDLYGNWERYEQSQRIAWKTGTSFGFRDAWAVGVTPEYTIGVWVGNADGEGRPGILGVKAAAPLLFQGFNHITEAGSWFQQPFDKEEELNICSLSGMRSGEYCDEKNFVSLPKNAKKSPVCVYHQRVYLSYAETEQLSLNCAALDEIKEKSWFIAPPLAEKYYKMRHPNYRSLPPFRQGCGTESQTRLMDIIYPKKESTINVPKGFSGEFEHVILEATHRLPEAVIHWHLNEEYLGSTEVIHQVKCIPKSGENTLHLIDQEGNSKLLRFKVK